MMLLLIGLHFYLQPDEEARTANFSPISHEGIYIFNPTHIDT